MKRPEFGTTIALLTASIGKEMPDEQLEAWYLLLGDLTVEQLRKGILETLKTHRFAGFPPVGTILANAGAVSTDEPRLAWATVRDAIKRVGAYDSPEFADPVIHAVIRTLGGWPVVCDTLTDEMQWLEKQFLADYAAQSKVDLPDHMTARLHGIHEIANSREEHGASSAVQSVPRIGSRDSGQRRLT